MDVFIVSFLFTTGAFWIGFWRGYVVRGYAVAPPPIDAKLKETV